MKCPKCGYLGFETTERCRNCGYDFSLSAHVTPSPELPLRGLDERAGPLEDFDLSGLDSVMRDESSSATLDLDRVIGDPEPGVRFDPPAIEFDERPPAVDSRRAPANAAIAARTPDRADLPAEGLPLFSPEREEADDTPLITAPRPARPPLAVRRATPEVPRGRTRTPRHTPRDAGRLALELEPTADAPTARGEVPGARSTTAPLAEAASAVARLASLVADVLLLAGIDAAVLYLTLAIAGLGVEEWRVLPVTPMAAFLVLMNGGYLIAFTAAGGQTVGKMLTGIRVMGDDGQRVDVPGAVLRSLGCILSILTLGIGYVPAFVTEGGRALHDRLAGTRVVKAA